MGRPRDQGGIAEGKEVAWGIELHHINQPQIEYIQYHIQLVNTASKYHL
jgi:hypothetical protein